MTDGYERKWENRRVAGRSAGDEARDSYYGTPVIHKPHWKWLIIFYFYLGGISGASYFVAAIAEHFGGPHGKPIARAGHYLSLAALIPSPFLLILDLGRPERFLNMLRVVKLASPMSVGTWGLTFFGGFCTLSAMIQAAQDGLFGKATLLARLLLGLPSRTISAVGSLFGFFVAGYTGVLLAATAVPLWTKAYRLMGPLFLASALSTATAALALILSLGRSSHESIKRLERLERVAMLSELGLLLALRSTLGRTLAKPMEEGHLGAVYRGGVLGMGLIAPLILHARSVLLRQPLSRGVASLASLLVLGGGFCFRYVIVLAGRDSADDPQATFEITRSEDTQR
ncbi:MAG: polysulfide reductase NrfD [Ardenticatenales bacterium]|nr:polysulfide reductase NrfD [Ardenticatenales bacterium]